MSTVGTFFRQFVTGRLGQGVEAKTIAAHLDSLKGLFANSSSLSKDSRLALLQEGEAAVEAIKARLRQGAEMSPAQSKQLADLESSVATLRKDTGYQPNWTPKQVKAQPLNVIDTFQHAFDPLGAVPGVGTVTSALNMVIDVGQGQLGSAAGEAIGLLPFGGLVKRAKGLVKAGVSEAVEAVTKQLADNAASATKRFHLFREVDTGTLKMSFSDSSAAKVAIERAETKVGAQYSEAREALTQQLAATEGDAAKAVSQQLKKLDADYNLFNLDAAAAREKWDLPRTAYSAPLPKAAPAALAGFPEPKGLFKQYQTAPESGRVSFGHGPELQISQMLQQAVRELPADVLQSKSPADIVKFLSQRVDATQQLTSVERGALKEAIARWGQSL